MRAWLSLLGGLILWAAHFLAAYTIASLVEIRPQDRQALLLGLAALTLALLIATAALALRAWRGSTSALPGQAFRLRLSAMGAAIAAIAIVWQSAPAFWA